MRGKMQVHDLDVQQLSEDMAQVPKHAKQMFGKFGITPVSTVAKKMESREVPERKLAICCASFIESIEQNTIIDRILITPLSYS